MLELVLELEESVLELAPEEIAGGATTVTTRDAVPVTPVASLAVYVTV